MKHGPDLKLEVNVTLKKGLSSVAGHGKQRHYLQGMAIRVQPLTFGCPLVYLEK